MRLASGTTDFARALKHIGHRYLSNQIDMLSLLSSVVHCLNRTFSFRPHASTLLEIVKSTGGGSALMVHHSQ